MRQTVMLLLGATLLTSAVKAQSEKEKVKVKTGDPKPWTVKWSPASLFLAGKLSLHGEYNYKKKKSITFGVGIPVEQKFSRKEGDGNYSLNHKTFSVQGGYRMYLGKKTMTGFYFEPYLKYLNYKGGGSYINDKSPLIAERDYYNFSATGSTFGVGGQLGVQFMIAKVVALDFYILGPEANIGKLTGSFQDVSPYTLFDPWTEVDEREAREDVKDIVKDIPIVGDQLAENTEVNRTEKTVKTSYSGFLPGFRFGISIGVHF